jgi:hypothetical protein
LNDFSDRGMRTHGDQLRRGSRALFHSLREFLAHRDLCTKFVVDNVLSFVVDNGPTICLACA